MSACGARPGCAQTGAHRLSVGGATVGNRERRHVSSGSKDLGYVEGRDLQITYRSSDGYYDRLPALAEELVRLKPDVIVAAGLDAQERDANNTHRLGDTRRCSPSRLNRERSAANWQRHRARAVRCRIARQADGARARDKAPRT